MMCFSRVTLALIVFTVLACFGCTKSTSSNPTGASPQVAAQASAGSAGSAQKEKMKVGLVLDKGGKDDKSFNSAAFRGAMEAMRDMPVEVKEVECSDDSAFEPAQRTFAERDYPLVIAIGFSQVDSLKKTALAFPKTHFAIVDGKVDAPNVASLMFAEHEGSFLVGYLAGLFTTTGKVGFIGGMDVPLIRRFQMGYEAGAKAARPDVTLVSNYAGINSSAWANPGRGKELALDQYGKKVDVIFVAAGATGLGVFDAAEEKKLYAIGVDSNQNAIKPGRILTSMLKRVDTAVYQIIRSELQKEFKPGTRAFSLADKGVDYAVDEYNGKIIAPIRGKVEAMRADIMSGKVKVPDYYENMKK